MIRAVLADDQDMVRAGIRMILESEPDITVVGEAANGKEALRVADLEQPDVILVDIQMPVMDGLEATALLAGTVPVVTGGDPHDVRARRVRLHGPAGGSGRVHAEERSA